MDSTVEQLESRVSKLEDRLDRIEAQLEDILRRLEALEREVAIIRSNYVTKEDLHIAIDELRKEINAQTWKLVTFVCGFGTALVGATYFIALHAK